MLEIAAKETSLHISSHDQREYNALEEALPAERARLVRLCARLAGDAEVAEDLAQETLLEAWRNLYKLRDLHDEEGRAKWLNAIARNVCLRRARSHGRDLAHLAPLAAQDDESEGGIEELADEDYAIEIELEREDLAQMLDRALALLPPVTRDALIARYIDESPHAEIAGRLGLSEDALVQRLHRGKLALRRVITTHMPEEAAAYGMSIPPEQRLQQETHIFCPMCGKSHLIKYEDPSRGRVGFTCPTCWHLASLRGPAFWRGLNSPKAILNRQLARLGEYYYQAINERQAICPECNHMSTARICLPRDIPQEYYLEGWHTYYGIYITCSHCNYEEINPLPHLTIDTPEAQRFWRKHPRLQWLPAQEIEYSGQPALLSSFQSRGERARLDVVFQRETLQILGIHESTR